MKDIRMVDLHAQYLKIKNEIDDAIQGVIDATSFIKGPEVEAFQRDLAEYLKVEHVIACGNGTDALQIALMALDLNRGDEIITTPFTFISTIEVIVLLGLRPVLVDIDYNTFNIDTEAIEDLVTAKTKVILPVHLFGQCADMNKIMEIASKYNLYIVEDAAQALGSRYQLKDGRKKNAGTIGHIGCTSFFPSKNLGAFGDGGAIITDNDELADKIKTIANHGMKTRYYYDYIGLNSRLDSIQAAILRVKLKYLDQYNEARQKAADFYDNAFASHNNIGIPYRDQNSTHIFHQYTLRLENIIRGHLKDFLSSKGIPSMVYYPRVLHLQKAFSDFNYKQGDFPISEKLSEMVLSLPMHSELDEKQLQYITENVLEYTIKNS